MTTSAWVIYYRAGRKFSSADGSWADAPADGVLAVSETIGDARTIRCGGDYYRLIEETGEVVVHETADALLHMIGHMPMSTIKFGICVGPSEFERVMRMIVQDHGS